MTLNTTALALLSLGFVAGVTAGVSAMPSRAPASEPSALTSRAPMRPNHVTLVQDTAVACGVYGLPGSPAVVALTAGEDGRPVRASLESDIFGGPDAEACLLAGVAGLPMTRDSLRIVLPVHAPEETETSELAFRLDPSSFRPPAGRLAVLGPPRHGFRMRHRGPSERR
jgi:hypothetical protein